MNCPIFRNHLSLFVVLGDFKRGGVPIMGWAALFYDYRQMLLGHARQYHRDWKDTIDISDLTSLVAWMFRSGITPPCMLEADINADSVYDILDLTSLVAYMFKSGPAPASCSN